MQNKKLIYGFHSILSVIRSNPSSIKELFLDESRNDGRMQQLIKAAEEKEIKRAKVKKTYIGAERVR